MVLKVINVGEDIDFLMIITSLGNQHKHLFFKTQEEVTSKKLARKRNYIWYPWRERWGRSPNQHFIPNTSQQKRLKMTGETRMPQVLSETAPLPHTCFLPDGHLRTVKQDNSKKIGRIVSYYHNSYDAKQMGSIRTVK